MELKKIGIRTMVNDNLDDSNYVKFYFFSCEQTFQKS